MISSSLLATNLIVSLKSVSIIMYDFMSNITHAYWDYFIHSRTRFLFRIVYSLMIWYTNVTKRTLVVIICPFVAMPIHLQRHHNVNNSYAYNIYLNLRTHPYTHRQAQIHIQTTHISLILYKSVEVRDIIAQVYI